MPLALHCAGLACGVGGGRCGRVCNRLGVGDGEMSEDLSRTVSEAMGKPWRKPTHGRCCTCQTCGQYYDDGCLCDWADNPEKSALLEDEIERRGLSADYVSAIIDIVRPESGGKLVWAVIRATPEQRARAFLEAMNARTQG